MQTFLEYTVRFFLKCCNFQGIWGKGDVNEIPPKKISTLKVYNLNIPVYFVYLWLIYIMCCKKV